MNHVNRSTVTIVHIGGVPVSIVYRIVLPLLIFFCAGVVMAQEEKPQQPVPVPIGQSGDVLIESQNSVPPQSNLKLDTLRAGKFSLTGYPYVFYTPETEFALGGALVMTYKSFRDTTIKPTNIVVSAYYSVKEQYDIYIVPEFFSSDGKFYMTGYVDIGHYIDKYWGYGNTSPDIDSLANYTRDFVAFNVDFEFVIMPELRIGLNYEFNNTVIADKQQNPYLLDPTIPGASANGLDGGIASGMGLAVGYDTRNSLFFPTSGTYAKLATLQCTDWLGSDFTFNRLIMDLRQYVPFGKTLTFAAQGYWQRAVGAPPFYMSPLLGGKMITRGYYLGRFRDEIFAAAQGEIRWMPFERFGFIAFAGAGQVTPNYHGFALDGLKPTSGFGLRFTLDPENRLNVRMDMAFGQNTKGVYFDVKEAF